MSQSKTRVPGMEDKGNSPVVGDPYARTVGGSSHKGTVVPGMNVGTGVQNANPADYGSKPVLAQV